MDAFERNLENVQQTLGMDPRQYISVVYRTELESSQIIAALPTLLLIAAVLYGFRRGAGMMSSASGGARRGGGLFGFGESTARMINKEDIKVAFK